MTSDLRRLLRLARAQSDLARLLEHRIAAEQQRSSELGDAKLGMLSALEQVSTSGLMFYSAAMRRLAELDQSIAASDQARRDLAGKLLQARTRRDALLRRAASMQSSVERKATEEAAREVTLAMQEKATGKPSVVK